MQIDVAQQLIFNQNGGVLGGVTSGVPVLCDLNFGGKVKFETVCAISVRQKIQRDMDFCIKNGQFYHNPEFPPKVQT